MVYGIYIWYLVDIMLLTLKSGSSYDKMFLVEGLYVVGVHGGAVG
jgi:hypothetical protein